MPSFSVGVYCKRHDTHDKRITYRIDADDEETAAREAINQHAKRLGEPKFDDERPLTQFGNCYHAGPWSAKVS